MKNKGNKIGKDNYEFLSQAFNMADKASAELMNNFRKDRPVQRGTVKEVKIIYDKISDRIIRDSIEKNFPLHSLITEESGRIKRDSEYLWIIDPLDGTSNYASHNPFFSVSISLWKSGSPLIGLIDAPMLKERFYAVSGHGAYHIDFLRNEQKTVYVSDIKNPEKAYGVYCEGGVKDKKRSLSILKSYYMKLRDVRKLGSAAIELAFVGTGRSESYMTTEISIWDIAAGIIFVKEAGGEICHFNGIPYKWSEFDPDLNFDIVATNGSIRINLVNGAPD